MPEGFKLGDQTAGFSFGSSGGRSSRRRVRGRGSGDQDIPDNDQDGMDRDDDGLVLGRSVAVAAGCHQLPVVSGFEVPPMPGRPSCWYSGPILNGLINEYTHAA